MWLGIKNVIMANHMISLITSSTTNPRTSNATQLVHHIVFANESQRISSLCLLLWYSFNGNFQSLLWWAWLYSKLPTYRQLGIGWKFKLFFRRTIVSQTSLPWLLWLSNFSLTLQFLDCLETFEDTKEVPRSRYS